MLTLAGALYGVGIDIRAQLMRQAPPGSRVNLLPNEPVRKLDELLTTLDQKIFSLIEGEVDADPQRHLALGRGSGPLSGPDRRLQVDEDLYANTNRTAADYTSQVRNLRASFLRQLQTLQKDVNIDVPEQIMTTLKMTVTDGQPQTALVQIVPSPMQSRTSRAGSGSPRHGPEPGQLAGPDGPRPNPGPPQPASRQ